MIQQLLSLLPRQISSLSVSIALAGALLGVILWLGGSRFSRTLVTLISVSVGTVLGIEFPRWFHFGLEGWATAILGALIFGISGYFLHKAWVGVGLGLVWVCWAVLGTFVLCGDQTKEWVWPVARQGQTLVDYLTDIWNALTPEARRILPFACATALLSGIAAAVLWPRLGVVLLYSCAGISLFVGLGVAAMSATRPGWLTLIPGQTSSQVIVLVSMVAFGAVLQWRAAPGVVRGAGGGKGR